MNKIALTVSVLSCLSSVASADTISDIKFGQDKGTTVLIFEGANVLPIANFIKKNNALVLDFPKSKPSFTKRSFTINRADVKSMYIVPGDDKTRAVINFGSNTTFKIGRKGKDIVLTLNVASNNSPVATPVSKPTQVQQTKSSQSSNNSTVNGAGIVHSNTTALPTPHLLKFGSNNTVINKPIVSNKSNTSFIQYKSFAPVYKKIGANTSTFSFAVSDLSDRVLVTQNGRQLIITIPGLSLSKADQKRMDFTGYKSLLNFADIFRVASGTKVVLNLNSSNYDYDTYQRGSIYTITLEKKVQSKQSIQDIQNTIFPPKKYTGKPLSLNFQDIEVRAVLQIIAEFTGLNIVVSDSVTGNITLRLDDVPWDQALDIILKTKSLGKRENGNVIYVAPSSELDSSEIAELKAAQEKKELVPSRTELIQVKYANAANLAKIIENSRSSGNVNSPGSYLRDSILSSKGSITVDVRTNTLLVNDIPSKIQAVRDFIAKLDEPVRQVLIDARIVLTTDDFTKDLGSKFGVSFFKGGNGGLLTGSGSDSAAVQLNKQLVDRRLAGTDGPVGVHDLTRRLGVDMAVAGPSYGLAILAADFLVDMELSALQTEGKAEIISSPRVVTQDGQTARIASGQQIPYTSVSKDGASKVDFKQAELSLDVTPRIAPDDRVDMNLDIKKDAPNPGLQSGGNIGIDTNQIHTDVLVDNGETIVLGGIFDQSKSFSKEKVPLLGDIPVIGHAFSTTKNNLKKKELVIFVTPRIIDNKLSDYDKFSNLRQ